MGHQNIDIDALGSSMGIYRLAKTIGKPAIYIVAQDFRNESRKIHRHIRRY